MDNPQKEFSRIYDQHIGRIYRFVFLRVSSTEVAQDITSETFSRAWSSFIRQKNEVKNWLAFLYQIARNLIVDFYRDRDRLQVVSANAVTDSFVAGVDLAEKAALSSEMLQIKQALSKLGQEQQEVVIWRYLDGLSNKEIAQLLDKPEGTVRVIIHRALESLKAQL